MNFVLGIISALFGQLLGRVQDILHVEAAVVYVAGVRKARQAFIALLGLAVFLMLALGGFVLVHVALFAWLPWSTPVKALILLILGMVYLGGGLAVVLGISSDQAWMRFAKVDRILANLPPRR
jgi:hypothetical protein